jgi:hypothetical protein
MSGRAELHLLAVIVCLWVVEHDNVLLPGQSPGSGLQAQGYSGKPEIHVFMIDIVPGRCTL